MTHVSLRRQGTGYQTKVISVSVPSYCQNELNTSCENGKTVTFSGLDNALPHTDLFEVFDHTL
jgi:hypothetical protein